MPRQKSPGGKSVTMSARFTEAEAAEIDALRVGLPRAEWVRRSVLAANRRTRAAIASQLESDARHAADEVPVVRSGRRPRVAVAVPFREPEPEAAPKPRAKQPCEHRVRPGSYCRSCERLI